MVIEAIVEDLDAKSTFFNRLKGLWQKMRACHQHLIIVRQSRLGRAIVPNVPIA